MPKDALRQRISVGFKPEVLEWLREQGSLAQRPISRILGQLIEDEMARQESQRIALEDQFVSIGVVEESAVLTEVIPVA